MRNWQQKILALLSAVVIWVFVHQSIITTKTIPNVPIRIINLPQDKTITGLLPNGLFHKRLNLTLEGTQSVIENLEQGDFEILLDAKDCPEDWMVKIHKKHLNSLDPDLDLTKHVTSISQEELLIHLSPLVTKKVPIWVDVCGEAPKGYQYIQVFPQKLIQEISGPEPELVKLEEEGLHITLDLHKIDKEQLDLLALNTSSILGDEVSYKVPPAWKKFDSPSLYTHSLRIPENTEFKIHFLKDSLVPLEQHIPVVLFFSQESSSQINPKNTSVFLNELIEDKHGVPYLSIPLFVHGVSKQFVDITRSQWLIVIHVNGASEHQEFSWNITLVNPKKMEDRYVETMLDGSNIKKSPLVTKAEHEKNIRHRFREYLQNLRLYTAKGKKLCLTCHLEEHQIVIEPVS